MGHSFIILLLIVTFSIFIIIDFAFINLHLTIFELNTLDFYVFTISFFKSCGNLISFPILLTQIILSQLGLSLPPLPPPAKIYLISPLFKAALNGIQVKYKDLTIHKIRFQHHSNKRALLFYCQV